MGCESSSERRYYSDSDSDDEPVPRRQKRVPAEKQPEPKRNSPATTQHDDTEWDNTPSTCRSAFHIDWNKLNYSFLESESSLSYSSNSTPVSGSVCAIKHRHHSFLDYRYCMYHLLKNSKKNETGTPCRVMVKDEAWICNDSMDGVVTVQYRDYTEDVEDLGDTECILESQSKLFVLTVFPLDMKPFIRFTNGTEWDAEAYGASFGPPDEKELAVVRGSVVDSFKADIVHMISLAASQRSMNAYKLLRAACEKGWRFMDLSFPPNAHSLFPPGEPNRGEWGRDLDKEYVWHRPELVYPSPIRENIRLFKNRMTFSQGGLGNCWLHAACASLFQRDDKGYIRAAFLPPNGIEEFREMQRAGAYCVMFNKDGWWRYVIVDSYLPSKFIFPAFAQNKNHPAEMFMPYLEKACAKVYGSYNALVSQSATSAFASLTGFPSITEIFPENIASDKTASDALITKLKEWVVNRYSMTISTGSKRLSEMAQKKLSENHCHSLLNVKSVGDLHLLKIRNPHGTPTWTGDWGAGSALWERHPAMKERCPTYIRGEFWMSWEDVVKYFSSVCVCFTYHLAHHYWDYRLPCGFSGMRPICGMVITANKSMEGYFTLHQPVDHAKTKGGKASTEGHLSVQLSFSQLYDNSKTHMTDSDEELEEGGKKFKLEFLATDDPDHRAKYDRKSMDRITYYTSSELTIPFFIYKGTRSLLLPPQFR